ncbi:MAG: NAD-dependent deacylase [Rhodospirillaceae bacterium]|nr:NAD-dependent deacylase [Rhodospirillaceae bacterium]
MPPDLLSPKIIPPPGGRIVILTGAGISKESGLETFRDAGGIWSRVRVEDVATPEAFARDPERCHAFYNMRRARHRAADVQPNAAHQALVRLEAEWPGEVVVVTQNVDSLHDRAGTKNLIHMHGIYSQARCTHCDHVADWPGDMSVADRCASCGQTGGLRPNVVWFGEMPIAMERITAALTDCDLFISIGTSGNVFPAAGFVAVVRKTTKAHTAELNLEPSAGATLFAEAHYGPATEIVPAYIEGLLRTARLHDS